MEHDDEEVMTEMESELYIHDAVIARKKSSTAVLMLKPAVAS